MNIKTIFQIFLLALIITILGQALIVALFSFSWFLGALGYFVFFVGPSISILSILVGVFLSKRRFKESKYVFLCVAFMLLIMACLNFYSTKKAERLLNNEIFEIESARNLSKEITITIKRYEEYPYDNVNPNLTYPKIDYKFVFSSNKNTQMLVNTKTLYSNAKKVNKILKPNNFVINAEMIKDTDANGGDYFYNIEANKDYTVEYSISTPAQFSDLVPIIENQLSFSVYVPDRHHFGNGCNSCQITNWIDMTGSLQTTGETKFFRTSVFSDSQ